MPDASTLKPPADDVKVVGEVLEIRVDRVRRYEKQPRTYFNPESIASLARNIEQDGQREPIEICRLNGEKNTNQPFLLVDGERRWRAIQSLGSKRTIRAILSDIKDEKELFRRSVSANLHREDMMPVDIANAIQRLAHESGMKRGEIADMFGKSTTYVDQYLSLRKLAPEVQKLLDPRLPDDQRLRVTVAIQIAKVPFDDLQIKIAEEAIVDNMPATDVNRRIHEYATQRNFSVPGRTRQPNEEYKLIRATLGRARKGLERVEKIDLEWVLLHRDDGADKDKILEQLDAIIKDADQLRERAKKIRESTERISF